MTAINFVNSEKLNVMYEDNQAAVINSTIEPLTKRIDKIGATNSSSLQDSFTFQEGKDYMDMQIKKSNLFTVVYSCYTQPSTLDVNNDIATAATTGTHPAPLNNWNWTVDNFALSKAINNITISVGQSELKDGTDMRNPFLYEVKSSQFDLEECKHYGQMPLQDSGRGGLVRTHSAGPLSRAEEAVLLGPAFTAASPLDFVEAALKSEGGVAWRYMNNGQTRAKIQSVSFTVGGVGRLANSAVPGYNGEFVPVTADLNGLPSNNIVYGAVVGTYKILVEEYLIGHYLTTPYQKNKRPKVIKIRPWNFVKLDFGWDTNYIQNGMFKISTNKLSYENAGFDAFANGNHVFNATRDITTGLASENNAIELRSFDLLVPPPDEYMMRMIAWEPTAVQSSVVSIDLKDKQLATTPFSVLDQTSNILSKYWLIAADPKLYNGEQQAKLKAGGLGQINVSTLMPAEIKSCRIEINQTNVTENVPISELVKMTQDIINNPELRDVVGANQLLTQYGVSQYEYSKGGCPFLLLDIDRLNMMSAKDGQLVSNVEYPTVQTVKISFTVQAQYHNFRGANGLTTTLTYYPHVYKFLPYAYSQIAGQPIVRNQLFATFRDATEAILHPQQNIPAEFDLDIIGGGWFDNVKLYFGDRIKDVGKSVIDGVRFLESASNHVGKFANNVSEYSRDNWGYGARPKSRSSSKNKAKAIMRR
jgi:hypothetical protein